ncbi:MAG: 6-bladed beta-propeller [Bacteroidales bacterium]
MKFHNQILYRTLVIHLMVMISVAAIGQVRDTIKVQESKPTEIKVVKWIEQWPSSAGNRQPATFKTRFNKVFLGKKTPDPVRPVALFAVDPDNFWALDQGVRSIFHVVKGVGDIPQFLQKSDARFLSLVGICSTALQEILFTDSQANRIFRLSPDRKKIEVLDDSLQLDQPTGIAYAEVTNEIWVVETNAHRITVLNDRGKVLRHIGSRGTGKGEFNYPTHIWIGKSGLVYVVDAMNFRVQVFRLTGEVVSVFGQPGDASGFLARPKGIAADSHGNIYIVDALFHVVQVFNFQGEYLYAFGNQGHGAGEFWMPSGIFIDGKDNIYVADSYNSRVQIFQLDIAEK